MFDVLMYLFENYFHAEIYPEPDQLAKKLTAVGFEEEEISQALEWLSGLQDLDSAHNFSSEPAAQGFRCYADDELAKLDTASRGFLTFLEGAGALDARVREMVIDCAMALPEPVVSLRKFKVIALMVMWSQHTLVDSLIVEELLSESADPGLMH